MLSFLNLLKSNHQRINCNVANMAIREYAARKGTRERKEKLKKKRKEEVKPPPPKKIYGKLQDMVFVKQRPRDTSTMESPIDDVYFTLAFRPQEYKFKEVLQMHKETHHETMYNQPEAPLYLRIDMDFKYPNRATKCMDPWKSLVQLRVPLLMPGTVPPTILAFCQEDADQIRDVTNAGAELAGGRELIKALQEGEVRIADYDYVVCHPLLVTELTAIRGLMKQKFPSIKGKTIGADLPAVVTGLKNSLKISVQHSDLEPDFGYIQTCMGKLNMDPDDLEANFFAIMQDTLSKRVTGKTPEQFILRCYAYTAYSFEKLLIDWRECDVPTATTAPVTRRRREYRQF